MATLRTLLLLGLLFTTRGQRAAQRRRPPPPQSALEKVAAQEGLNLHQLSGKWFLVSMASRCSYLAEHSHQLEATMMTVTVLDGQSLAISTFRKLDRMCWEIRQHYLPAQAPGRFLLKGHRKSSKVDVVVGEADASSFIILYYQKGRSISVKLYGRSSLVSDTVMDKFEQRIRAVGLSEDVTYHFPTYGGWHTVLRETHVGSVPMLRSPQGQRCKDGTVPCNVLGVQGLEHARSQTRGSLPNSCLLQGFVTLQMSFTSSMVSWGCGVMHWVHLCARLGPTLGTSRVSLSWQ
ncbi:complement component C8 gamma chain isoform X9 [Catharus ustulatus]|uniref:complement component C8 gamma chain isoform X9 n=1 Tax=Catharus ustulatus TaxID=91951 RepID=UPI0014073B19|nr:complement component C8 gamma chain isoform X9 [Catharus ustulatus]